MRVTHAQGSKPDPAASDRAKKDPTPDPRPPVPGPRPRKHYRTIQLLRFFRFFRLYDLCA